MEIVQALKQFIFLNLLPKNKYHTNTLVKFLSLFLSVYDVKMTLEVAYVSSFGPKDIFRVRKAATGTISRSRTTRTISCQYCKSAMQRFIIVLFFANSHNSLEITRYFGKSLNREPRFFINSLCTSIIRTIPVPQDHSVHLQ